MTAAEPLLLESRPTEGVALLQLHRPEVRNALNLALRRELAAAFQRLSADDTVRAIVLTGDDKAFCAGADLREYVDASPTDLIARNMTALWGAVAGCPKPVIAAVNGYALGGGCELAMHADIIVAGEGAKFGQPEVRIGLIPGGGATQRLSRVAGKFVTMRLLLTGEIFGAAEAKAMGLVSRLVEDGQVLAEALRLAEEIAAQAPLAARFIKEAVLDSMNSSLDAGLRNEMKTFQLIFSTADKKEGIQAFLDKRKPQFRGM